MDADISGLDLIRSKFIRREGSADLERFMENPVFVGERVGETDRVGFL